MLLLYGETNAIVAFDGKGKYSKINRCDYCCVFSINLSRRQDS